MDSYKKKIQGSHAKSAFTSRQIFAWTSRVVSALKVRIRMDGELKGIIDVAKWNSQGSESVRHALERAATKGLPCVGYSLVYMDYKGDHIEWKFETILAFDPNNPPEEEERQKLEAIFAGYARMCQKLMDHKEGGSA